MRTIAEVGDKVVLSGYYGKNKSGGTEIIKDVRVETTVLTAFDDYECGWTYSGKLKGKKSGSENTL